MSGHLVLAQGLAKSLEPYLPPRGILPVSTSGNNNGDTEADVYAHSLAKPFVTLTFATSMDSCISLRPGVQTHLSGPESKAMTHYLRSRHDAILVGVGTAAADDPSLNCRLAMGAADAGSSNPGAATTLRQPRPIILDPHARWAIAPDCKVLQLARAGQGLAPFVLTAVREPPRRKREALERLGGKFVFVETNESSDVGGPRFNWHDVLQALAREQLRSVMIEGGGRVINALLEARNQPFLDSIVVTLAPLWLGQGGVAISPERSDGSNAADQPVVRLDNVSWHPLGRDVVMCGTPHKQNADTPA
jgi:2,5-diamino-6-(ribosylamino)-4(3H)-pyrimidinone 5'-phosphate reductase